MYRKRVNQWVLRELGKDFNGDSMTYVFRCGRISSMESYFNSLFDA